mmetsp:Transcript_13494/g.39400  ORF Transcript_13494/g.39400 Transcript_13494/m.39400 type:complete len:84 (-) Transcript_13494:54-305(-)
MSKLQTETAMLTMEAEYVALITSMKELLTIIRLVKGVAAAVGMETEEVTRVHISVHKENAGALNLAKLEPPQLTPRSKCYGTK